MLEAVKGALDYLTRNGIEVPVDVWQKALKARVFKAEGGLPVINADYHDRISQALIGYFEGSGSVTAPRNEFKRAMVEAFGAAFDLGWQEGGGELPADSDAQDWLAARVDAEMGYIDQVLQNAKELRAEGGDYFEWVTARADGFTGSVASVYNYAKMAAAGNQMLTWKYDGGEHCSTCASLNGKTHRATWYLARDYIPGKPGAAMQCGGYNCKCVLLDRNGDVFAGIDRASSKHYGPGPHPGTGTPQDVHGGDGGGSNIMRRMTSEEITASLAEYRERTISIARDAPKTRAPGNLQKYIDDAYSQGVVARRMGLTSGEEAMHYEQFWNAFQNYDIPERESFEAGLRGAEKPYWVNGWRYGDIPSGGYSMNFAEGRPERGISVMGTDDGRTTGDPGFEMFTRNREIIYVSGFVNTTSTGSDGEPLLMWARKTGVRK